MKNKTKIDLIFVFNNPKFLNKSIKNSKKTQLFFTIPKFFLKTNVPSYFLEKKISEKIGFLFFKKFSFFFLNKILIFYQKKLILPLKIKNLFWFRLELRTNHNRILKKILNLPNNFIVLICLDSKNFCFFGKKKKNFLNETIENLKKNLKKKKINFIFENGNPEQIILKLYNLYYFKKVLFYFEKNLHWKNSSKKEKTLIKNLSDFKLKFKILNPNLIIFQNIFSIFFCKNFQNCFFFYFKNLLSITIKKYILKKFRKNFIAFFIKKKIKKNIDSYKKFFFKKNFIFSGGEDFILLVLKLIKMFRKKIFFFKIIKNYYFLKPWADFGCVCLKNLANFYFVKNIKLNFYMFFNLFFKNFLVFSKIKKSDTMQKTNFLMF